MKKETTALLILAIITVAVLAVVGIAKYREHQHYFIYKGANGDYRIESHTIGNVTDYYVYALSENKLYLTPLRKTPQDVQNISLEPNLLDKINRPKGVQRVYITQDYETANATGQLSIIALQDIGKILGKASYGIYKLNVQGAFTHSTARSRDLDVPEISCANVNETVSVIYLTLGQENKVYSDKDCIIVEGKDADGLTLAANKFAYYLLGVF